jgi:predicted short-subunit dehydrogenase-like oxidoreductase (DUF2520 family)
MHVAILGLGRLGSSLVLLLRQAGVHVSPWARGQPIPSGADAYWITTGDAAVPSVAAALPEGAVALHAAGAHGPELLGARPERGVLHPLMTFPGPALGLPRLEGAGARIEGTAGAVAAAQDISARLGMRAVVTSVDTRAYHAAACLASGHLSALFLDAVAVATRAGLPGGEAAALLLPLALESLRRAAEVGPPALTGPAARGDVAAEQLHLQVLTTQESAIYLALADRIRASRATR